jgi:hypothetical protein
MHRRRVRHVPAPGEAHAAEPWAHGEVLGGDVSEHPALREVHGLE